MTGMVCGFYSWYQRESCLHKCNKPWGQFKTIHRLFMITSSPFPTCIYWIVLFCSVCLWNSLFRPFPSWSFVFCPLSLSPSLSLLLSFFLILFFSLSPPPLFLFSPFSVHIMSHHHHHHQHVSRSRYPEVEENYELFETLGSGNVDTVHAYKHVVLPSFFCYWWIFFVSAGGFAKVKLGKHKLTGEKVIINALILDTFELSSSFPPSLPLSLSLSLSLSLPLSLSLSLSLSPTLSLSLILFLSLSFSFSLSHTHTHSLSLFILKRLLLRLWIKYN